MSVFNSSDVSYGRATAAIQHPSGESCGPCLLAVSNRPATITRLETGPGDFMQNQKLRLSPAGLKTANSLVHLMELLYIKSKGPAAGPNAEIAPLVEMVRDAVKNAEVKQPHNAKILRLVINRGPA